MTTSPSKSSGQLSHIGYLDDSRYNVGRYRSIALVTLAIKDYHHLVNLLKTQIEESEIREFKWERLKNAKYRFGAIKMINFAVKYVCSHLLRIDVVIWDIEDRRHKVIGRDDLENLQRMYYHLLNVVLSRRWPYGSVWKICPDENSAIPWERLKTSLQHTGGKPPSQIRLITGEKKLDQTKYSIQQLIQVKSHEEPLLQLADLFAGISIFSREKFEQYQVSTGQQTMLENHDEFHSSNADVERFTVLCHLIQLCRSKSLEVQFQSARGLKTPNPNNPLNFWWYTPQSAKDKAPVREAR